MLSMGHYEKMKQTSNEHKRRKFYAKDKENILNKNQTISGNVLNQGKRCQFRYRGMQNSKQA